MVPASPSVTHSASLVTNQVRAFLGRIAASITSPQMHPPSIKSRLLSPIALLSCRNAEPSSHLVWLHSFLFSFFLALLSLIFYLNAIFPNGPSFIKPLEAFLCKICFFFSLFTKYLFRKMLFPQCYSLFDKTDHKLCVKNFPASVPSPSFCVFNNDNWLHELWSGAHNHVKSARQTYTSLMSWLTMVNILNIPFNHSNFLLQ